MVEAECKIRRNIIASGVATLQAVDNLCANCVKGKCVLINTIRSLDEESRKASGMDEPFPEFDKALK